MKREKMKPENIIFTFEKRCVKNKFLITRQGNDTLIKGIGNKFSAVISSSIQNRYGDVDILDAIYQISKRMYTISTKIKCKFINNEDKDLKKWRVCGSIKP